MLIFIFLNLNYAYFPFKHVELALNTYFVIFNLSFCRLRHSIW